VFIKVNEKNGISKSVEEQPRVLLLIFIGILLCYSWLPDKREEGGVKYRK
jgi:hypothetical protein